jgi:hypothetical protein
MSGYEQSSLMPTASSFTEVASAQFVVLSTTHLPAQEILMVEKETNRDKALRGEVVVLTDGRLEEMQHQAIACEGYGGVPMFHWHWAAAMNELIAHRAQRKG